MHEHIANCRKDNSREDRKDRLISPIDPRRRSPNVTAERCPERTFVSFPLNKTRKGEAIHQEPEEVTHRQRIFDHSSSIAVVDDENAPICEKICKSDLRRRTNEKTVDDRWHFQLAVASLRLWRVFFNDSSLVASSVFTLGKSRLSGCSFCNLSCLSFERNRWR